jgi:hypothetical protein
MSDLLNSASLVMIPSGYKEDVVYSQIPTDGSGDLSFTRASNGTRINSAGLVEVVAWNLLLNTNTFSSWDLEGGALTSGFTAPDSTSTAYKYVQVPGGGLYSGSASATSGVKTASVWLKSVSGTSITCILGDGDASNTTVVSVTGDWQLFTATYTTSTSRPSLYIYGISNASGIYVWHPQLNIGSTAKPYFPTTDRLNVPRLTYQNGGGGCPSLLLEKQSTNLVTYSEDFSNAAWTKFNASVTANDTTSPDGTQNADKLIENTANDEHVVYRAIDGTSKTFSFYAKAAGRNWLAVLSNNGTYTYFNVSNGTLGTIAATSTATIEDAGNGWYRCTVYNTHATYGAVMNLATANGTVVYTGNGTSGVYLWGAQTEASSYPTSYIPTTSASATRVADACSKTGISSLIGQTQGTMFIDTYVGNETDEVYGWLQASLSGNPNDSIQINRAGSNVQCQVYVGSTAQGIITGGTITKGQRIKVAVGYKQNDLVLYLNGTQIGTDTSTDIPTCAVFQLGAYPPLPNDYTNDGGINQAVLFKTRLTNAELASLTTI